MVGAMGDFVWHDINRNGIQDSNEPGVSGVRVQLFSPGPNGQIGGNDDVLIGERITNGLGFYVFAGLQPGAYFLQFDLSTLPSGFVPTRPNVGTDDRDSDADNQGRDSLTTVEAGEVDLSHDLGIT